MFDRDQHFLVVELVLAVRPLLAVQLALLVRYSTVAE